MSYLLLLLTFTLLPLVEFMLLLWINEQVGICMTIAFVLGTGALGAALAKWQSLSIWRQVILEVSHGRTPTNSMVDGILTLIAGVLLITPGVITDITGILLMFPPTRLLIRELLKKEFERRVKLQIATNMQIFNTTTPPKQDPAGSPSESEIFTAEYKVVNPKKRTKKTDNLSPPDPQI